MGARMLEQTRPKKLFLQSTTLNGCRNAVRSSGELFFPLSAAAFSHSSGCLVGRRPWSPPLVLLARPNWSHLSQRVQNLVSISIVGTTRRAARAAPDDPAAAVTIALSSVALTRRWRRRDFRAQVEGRGAKRSDERGMCDRVAPCLPLNREETTGKGESGLTYLRIWPSLPLEAVAGSPPTPAAAALSLFVLPWCYFEFGMCAVGPISIGSGRKCCICASRPRSIPK
jgi:hypothetical protein